MLLLLVEIGVSLSNISCLYQRRSTAENKKNHYLEPMNVYQLTNCLVAAFNKLYWALNVTSAHMPEKLMVAAAVPMKRVKNIPYALLSMLRRCLKILI
jgi:hypothetical protein